MKFPKLKIPPKLSKLGTNVVKFRNRVQEELSGFDALSDPLTTARTEGLGINAYEMPFGASNFPHLEIVSRINKTNKKEDFTSYDTKTANIYVLPFPISGFTDNLNMSWSSAKLGPLSMSIVESSKSAITNLLEGKSKLADLDDTLAGLKSNDVIGKLGQATAINVLKSSEGIIGVNLLDAYQASNNIAINPNEVQLFERVNYRTFSFEYKFMPASEKEAQELIKMIKQLKIDSIPGKDGAYFLTIPSIYSLEFKGSTGESLSDKYGKIMDCALTLIEVQYNSGAGNTFHRGDYPNDIILSLGFTEIDLLTKESFN